MLRSFEVWGTWILAFVVLEFVAIFLKPWHTLSDTIHKLIRDTHGWLSVLLVGGLSVLLVHLVAPQVFE